MLCLRNHGASPVHFIGWFGAYPDRFSQPAEGFGFHLAPELIVGNPARFLDLAAWFIEKRLELG